MDEIKTKIEDNPIRFGKEQFFKGKMAAYDRIERVIEERRSDTDNQDATMQGTYKYMADFISILRKSES